jgi:predicted transcriptional regulator of viral defense system
MTFNELRKRLELPYFYTYQLKKLFSDESASSIRIQLSRWEKSAKIIRLKRGLYIFDDSNLDEFTLASLIYQPSYISLESALNVAGIIPDVPQMVTSVTTIKPLTHMTSLGSFQYQVIKKSLYFGFETHVQKNGIGYDLSLPEKALLDLIYIHNLKSIKEYRIDLGLLDTKRLEEFGNVFPEWVRQRVYE